MSARIITDPKELSDQLLIKNMLFAPVAYNPEQTITYKGNVRFSYKEFRDRVHRLANMLVAVGIEAGDTVAVMDWDSNRYLEAYFAVPMMGAILHTINVRLSPEQLTYTISHAEDKVMLVHQDFIPLVDAIKGRLDTVQKWILLREQGSGLDGVSSAVTFHGEYEDLLSKSSNEYDWPDLDENTIATTFYTTGTTGLPKGVYFSHRQLVLHTLAGLTALGSNHGCGNFHRDDVYMPITPMFHVHAWGIPYMATMLGVKQVYPGKYVPAELMRLIVEEKVTFSHCVPTILHMLVQDPAAKNLDLSKWKVIIGGAALPKAVAKASLLRGIDVIAGYGMSETCPILTLSQLSPEEQLLDFDQQVLKRVRTGRPLPLVQLKIQTESGEAIKDDDKNSGEILVRSPWLTKGYLKDHTNSEKLWAGGWLHTNDVACIDSSRSVRITDRTKDVIKIGGEWISSLEIEDIICAYPGVGEAAIIGKPDVRWGEIPLALVVKKKDAIETNFQERDIEHHVKSYVDRGVLPKEVVLIRVRFIDAIDKTSVGKINKVALRTKYIDQGL